ncbi:MAG: ATP-dependent sacrificial sulfur transferase LarE [Deltaproteobacteria bacterium]|nr:ATP-dependent sacrificial sulfur transferase LarE [Deltaproteobacteria bacterium]
MWGPKLERLRAVFRRPGRWVVCLSGGVDSALVLAVAAQERGRDVVALTAVSPTLPEPERLTCVRLAQEAAVRHELAESEEMDREAFVSNGSDRCYHCKTELYSVARDRARELGTDWIADGVNVDDLGDHRPGLVAAREHDVIHPLIEAGMSKADVRGAARGLGLGVWDKPAFACLSSRFPYGTRITEEKLTQVGAVELFLKARGIRQVRVRSDGRTARIEVLPSDIARLAAEPLRGDIVKVATDAGFLWVSLDLQGYRTGSMNAGLVE